MPTSQSPAANGLSLQSRRATFALAAGLGIAASLLLGATLLWAHYGTAVFFEMIAAGIAACF